MEVELKPHQAADGRYLDFDWVWVNGKNAGLVYYKPGSPVLNVNSTPLSEAETAAIHKALDKRDGVKTPTRAVKTPPPVEDEGETDE